MYSKRQTREIRKLYYKCQKTYALSDLMFAFSSSEKGNMEIFEKVNNESSSNFVLNRVNQSNSTLLGTLKFVSLQDCMPTFCKDLKKDRISNLDLWILENIVLYSKDIEQIKRLDAGFKVTEIIKDMKSDLISSVKNDFDDYCKIVYHTNNQELEK